MTTTQTVIVVGGGVLAFSAYLVYMEIENIRKGAIALGDAFKNDAVKAAKELLSIVTFGYSDKWIDHMSGAASATSQSPTQTSSNTPPDPTDYLDTTGLTSLWNSYANGYGIN